MRSKTRVYRKAIRPALFALPAGTAHELGKKAMKASPIWRLIGPPLPSDPRLRVNAAGLDLRNPVGLAAGFDKNAEMIPSFEQLGFGYISPGTIRTHDLSDNPRPNLVRLPSQGSLVNCVGIPSKGGPYAASRIRAHVDRTALPGRMAVIPNIGGFTIDEYVETLEAVQPAADAVEIGLQCPNEEHVDSNFLHAETFRKLMTELNSRKTRPFFVKIRNFANDSELASRRRLVEMCLEFGVDGVTMSGARIVHDRRLSKGQGNLTGRDVFEPNLRNVKEIYSVADGQLAIKALGGVATAADAFRLISAGASTVELLTSLIYEGWAVAHDINVGLSSLLDRSGIASVASLRGSLAACPN